MKWILTLLERGSVSRSTRKGDSTIRINLDTLYMLCPLRLIEPRSSKNPLLDSPRHTRNCLRTGKGKRTIILL